jgi:hypothetical protein
VFGSLADLLAEQFGRLSALEQTVLGWLAIMREPVTLEELRSVLVPSLPAGQVLDAVDGLLRCSLIEIGQRPGNFTLQPVVLEHVTADLVARLRNEIQQGRLGRLITHGLCQAQAALPHHLFEVAVAQGIAAVPANAEQDLDRPEIHPRVRYAHREHQRVPPAAPPTYLAGYVRALAELSADT